MAKVNVFFAQGNIRSVYFAQAACYGLKKVGDKVKMREAKDHKLIDADYAVFYGFAGGLRDVYNDYREYSTVVYADLGYWKRRIRTRYDGYYKMVVNDRHPTAYFQTHAHPIDRTAELNLKARPWKTSGTNIILAGMSEKASRAEGLIHQAWERDTFAFLKRVTDRPIIYRPKPSCCRSRFIKGALYDKTSSPETLFKDAWAIVTRHSNIAVEAILAGVPAFVEAGVALPMSETNLRKIETPFYPVGRKGWANDIAWCQFTKEEISQGLPFMHLKQEGLIP